MRHGGHHGVVVTTCGLGVLCRKRSTIGDSSLYRAMTRCFNQYLDIPGGRGWHASLPSTLQL